MIECSKSLKAIYLNARSCNNKTTEINDLIIEKNADITFISETWLKDNDNITVTNLVPKGFSIINKNRKSRSGGDVAIIYKSSLEILSNKIVTDEFSSFECISIKVKTADSKSCFLSCIYYRPTKSKKNIASFSTFLSEFNDYLENLSAEQKVFIFGDFNVHFENSNDSDVLAFKCLINEHDFSQSVVGPTHIKGHTLDLFLSRCSENFVPSVIIIDLCISDHFVLTIDLPFRKPKNVVNSVNSRSLKAIDTSVFKDSLFDSLNVFKDTISSLSLTNCVKNVIDKFAPVKNRVVTISPAAPWINLIVKSAKQARRKAERMFNKTGLTIHREIFKYCKNKTIKIINNEKSKYINEKISSSNTSKQLYSVFGNLTGK